MDCDGVGGTAHRARVCGIDVAPSLDDAAADAMTQGARPMRGPNAV
jgi:hypothetical protein